MPKATRTAQRLTSRRSTPTTTPKPWPQSRIGRPVPRRTLSSVRTDPKKCHARLSYLAKSQSSAEHCASAITKFHTAARTKRVPLRGRDPAAAAGTGSSTSTSVASGPAAAAASADAAIDSSDHTEHTAAPRPKHGTQFRDGAIRVVCERGRARSERLSGPRLDADESEHAVYDERDKLRKPGGDGHRSRGEWGTYGSWCGAAEGLDRRRLSGVRRHSASSATTGGDPERGRPPARA